MDAARLLRLDITGEMRLLDQRGSRLRGLSCHSGFVYAAAKGGYTSWGIALSSRYGERTVLIDKLPDGGWHEPGSPVFNGKDNMYFAQVSIAQQGVIEPACFTVHGVHRCVPFRAK